MRDLPRGDGDDDPFAPLASLMPPRLRLVAADRADRAMRRFGKPQRDERPFTVKCCGWCFAPLGRDATDCDHCGARFRG